MIVRPLHEKDMDSYGKKARLYGTIFDSLEWLSLFRETVQIYGFFDKNNMLQGGFHLNRIRKYGFSMYQNAPFTPSIGPFIKIEAQNPVSIMSIWKRVLALMADFIDTLPYSILTCSLNYDIVDMQPFIWKHYKVVPGYTYILKLGPSSDELKKKMSNERRKNINKGQKDGLDIRQISDMQLIKSLVLKTFLRQKININEFYLDKILFDFASDDNSFAYAAFNNADPIACSLCIYDAKTAYYILGGYDSESKHHGAGALCIWHSILQSKKLGLNFFDFEGSMVPQIERYFRGFGGELTPIYRINKAILPLEIILKFIKRDLF